jgi:transketolase C-terminal domain/subunit
MTSITTTQALASTVAGGGVQVIVDGQVLTVVRDGSTILRRIDAALEAAGFVRTTGWSVASVDLGLNHTMGATVAAVAA